MPEAWIAWSLMIHHFLTELDCLCCRCPPDRRRSLVDGAVGRTTMQAKMRAHCFTQHYKPSPNPMLLASQRSFSHVSRTMNHGLTAEGASSAGKEHALVISPLWCYGRAPCTTKNNTSCNGFVEIFWVPSDFGGQMAHLVSRSATVVALEWQYSSVLALPGSSDSYGRYHRMHYRSWENAGDFIR
jgi:hypothetical protein